MAELPPVRFFPAAPSLSTTRQLVQCKGCKEQMRLALGEVAQRRNPRDLGDRRACSCGRLQITGAPNWEERETIQRRLGI